MAEYQKKHPEFVQRKEMLKEEMILKAVHTIRDSIKDPKVAQWFLERKAKEDFSTKSEIEHSGGFVKKVFITKEDQKEVSDHIDAVINGD